MALRIVSKLINAYRIHKNGIRIGESKTLNGAVVFFCEKKKTIEIGNRFVVNSGKSYNMIGGDTRCIIMTIRDGKIKIGNNVGISNSAIIAMENITIDDDVRIGGSCKIYDNDFHSIDYNNRMQKPDTNVKHHPIHICKGAFIGAQSIILKGVTIGAFSVVGAGSVVTCHIPDGQVWAGNPARFIKCIDGRGDTYDGKDKE